MAWNYKQATGAMARNATVLATGYSGHGDGLNNPAAQTQHDVGPIPAGRYTIAAPFDSPHTGPFTLRLDPDPANQMFGRDAFRIHGDNGNGDHSASNGCIILGREFREAIWNSGDRALVVAA